MSIDAFLCGDCDAIFDEPVGPVYECSRCGATQIEENRCSQCHIFMGKVADEACPDCESAEPNLSAVVAYEAADGSRHLTAAEADAWDADAPKRAERAAEAKAEMDAMFEQRRKEARARAERLLPALYRLAEVLTPGAPDMLDTVTYTIDALVRDPEFGMIYTPSVRVAELARVLVPGDETEAAIAVGEDYERPYEERNAVCVELKARVLPLITNDELRERVADPFVTFGAGLGVDVEVLLDQFDCWEERP